MLRGKARELSGQDADKPGCGYNTHIEDGHILRDLLIVLMILSPMCVRPVGGARETLKVAMLPTHVSGLISFVCKDQDQGSVLI